MSDLPNLQFVEAPAVPDTFNVLLFGRPKQGKSTAAATAPGPILWINAEGPGALGYARKVAAQRGTRILEVALDKNTPNPASVLTEVYRHVKEQREPHVTTVVVDTLAKVREQLIRQLVTKGSKNTLQQFGDVADKLGGFITALRDLPVNLVLLAHVDVKDDPTDGRIIDPLIGGKLTETIPGEVDVVAYVASWNDDGTRRFTGQLVESKGRQGGDRSGAIADERGIRELDLTVWLGLYREGLTPKAPAPEDEVPWDDVPLVQDEAADVVDQGLLEGAA